MALSLCSQFSLQELRDSCPRDGLTRQFFTSHWDAILGPLLRGLQEIFDIISMLRSQALYLLYPREETFLYCANGAPLLFFLQYIRYWLLCLELV